MPTTTRFVSRRRLSTLTALAVLGGMLAGAGAGVAAQPAQASDPVWVADPASYVNTLTGTGEGGGEVGSINNFPGPAMPFGMVQFSPDNPETGQGYHYGKSTLRGFGINHASQGCGAFGDFPVLPTTVSTATSDKPWLAANTYNHVGEVGNPGYYKLISQDGASSTITSELTATERVGVAAFSYSDGVTPKVFVRPGQSNTKPTGATWSFDPATGVLKGSTTTGKFCWKDNEYTAYFAMKFEQPVAGYGSWDGSTTTAGGTSATGVGGGGYVTFAPGTTTVRAAIALSYVSADKAELNLETEVPTLDAAAFDSIRQTAYAAWNERLSVIKVSPAPVSLLSTFYHTLYRSLLHPNIFDDVDGQYIGFETSPKLHNVKETGQDHHYAQFSDWDTYRTLAPLQALLFPKEASDMAQSLVNDAVQSGSYPRWAFANAATNQMTGDNASALIAQTYAYGARDFDVEKALWHMVEGAIGETAGEYTGGTNKKAVQRPGAKVYNKLKYAPQIPEFQADHSIVGASITAEFSIDDFAIAQFAQALGDEKTAEVFRPRAHYWQNLFNPITQHISPRDANGKFPVGDPNVTPSDFGYRGTVTGYGQVGFEEGMAAHYRWLVPQNMAALITALGGRERAVNLLDAFMTNGLNVGAKQPYMWAGNEPNFQTPWVYNYAGRPDRTSEIVDQIRTTLFGPEPDGAEPGNDDLGAQASWYVWAAIGLFPTTPGTDILTVNTPAFDAIQLALGNGRTVTITAPGAATKRYVAGLSVDGSAQGATWLRGLTDGQDHTIAFTLAETAGSWGTAPEDAPPSFDDGGAPVATTLTPTWPSAKRGQKQTLELWIQRFDPDADQAYLMVTTPRAGMVIDYPSVVDLTDGGRARVELELTVAADAEEGSYPVTVTVIADGRVHTEQAWVRVTGTGTFASYGNVVASATRERRDGVGPGFDNAGASMSREQLSKKGLSPGERFGITGSAHTGILATWPDAADGTPDAVQPDGQVIPIAGAPTKLSFIGAAFEGPREETAEVTLDDGSTEPADLSFEDWVVPGNTKALKYGNVAVADMPDRNVYGNNDRTAFVFATDPYIAPPGRHIVSVRFPVAPKTRVFAIGTDARQQPLLRSSVAAARVGDTIQVSGKFFSPHEEIELTLGASTVDVHADWAGSFSTRIVAPEASGGQLALTATGGESGAASVSILVLPKAAVSAPSRTQLGASFTLEGAGFIPTEPVALQIGTRFGPREGLGSVLPNADGTIRTTVTLPIRADLVGSKWLSVVGRRHIDGQVIDVPVPLQVDKIESGMGAPVLSETTRIYGASTPTAVAVAVTGATHGTVHFRSGSQQLASAPIVADGAGYRATALLPPTLPAGTYGDIVAELDATTTYTAARSASSATALVVRAATPRGVKVAKRRFVQGSRPVVAVTVLELDNGQTPVGKAQVMVKGRVVATKTLRAGARGKVRIRLPKAHVALKVTAVFVPEDGHNVAGQRSRAVVLRPKR